VSDEGEVVDPISTAARAGGDTDDSRARGGQTAVVTEPAVRPQRPTGKRARLRAVETDSDSETDGAIGIASEDEVEVAEKGSKKVKGEKVRAAKKAKKTKAGDSANPFVFVYNYLKQVVAELRKVIWPNRKQMLSYTGVVLVFLAFMVALVGLADLGLAKLVMLVFG
jgi:preprotein translocase subunit SecE